MDNEDKVQKEENDVEIYFKQFLGKLNESPTKNLKSRIQNEVLNIYGDNDDIDSEDKIQEDDDDDPLQFYFKQCDMDDEDIIKEVKDVELYFKEFLGTLNELPAIDIKSRIQSEIFNISIAKDDTHSKGEIQEDSVQFYLKQGDVDNDDKIQEENDVELYFKQFLGKLNEIPTVDGKSRDSAIQKNKESTSSSTSFSYETAVSCSTVKNQQNTPTDMEEMQCDYPLKLLTLKPDSISNFSVKKAKLAKGLYDLFNQKVFDNKLPLDMPLLWCNRLQSTAGTTECFRKDGEFKCVINLSSKILTSLDRLRDTLLHEMCHAAVWVINKMGHIAHGPLWHIWAARCKLILPQIDLPLRCHNYELKFTYKFGCHVCKWESGRFKRHPSLLKKICRKCKGPLYMSRTQ